MTRADDDRIVGYSFRRARVRWDGSRVPVQERSAEASVHMVLRREDGSTRDTEFTCVGLPEPSAGMAFVGAPLRLREIEYVSVRDNGRISLGRPEPAFVMHVADGRAYYVNMGHGFRVRDSIPPLEEPPCPHTQSP